jgi:hypothetical protein
LAAAPSGNPSRSRSRDEPPFFPALPLPPSAPRKGSTSDGGEPKVEASNEQPRQPEKTIPEDLGSGASAAPEIPAGDTLESAAANVAGDARTSPHHDETWAAREKRRGEEEERLKAWAEARGKLGGRKVGEKGRGSEHILEPDAPNRRWIKQTRPEKFSGFGLNLNNTGQGATP